MFKVTLTFLQIFHPVFNLQVLKEGTTVAKTEKSILSSKKKIVLKMVLYHSLHGGFISCSLYKIKL